MVHIQLDSHRRHHILVQGPMTDLRRQVSLWIDQVDLRVACTQHWHRRHLLPACLYACLCDQYLILGWIIRINQVPPDLPLSLRFLIKVFLSVDLDSLDWIGQANYVASIARSHWLNLVLTFFNAHLVVHNVGILRNVTQCPWLEWLKSHLNRLEWDASFHLLLRQSIDLVWIESFNELRRRQLRHFWLLHLIDRQAYLRVALIERIEVRVLRDLQHFLVVDSPEALLQFLVDFG